MKVTFLLLTLFAAFPLMAQSKCSTAPKDYAREYVLEELYGRRAQKASSCLVEKNFKHISPVHDPISENTQQTVYDVSLSSLKILKVEEVDPKLHHYRVEFELKRAGSDQRVRDSLEFMLKVGSRCSVLLKSPGQRLRSECL